MQAAGWSVRVELDDPELLADEVRRLEKHLGKLENDVERAAKKLENPKFVENAKPEVVAAEREKHARLSEEHASVSERLANLRRAVGGTP